MDEVTLDSSGTGRSLTLRRVKAQDDETFWSYQATLRMPEGQMTTEVYDHGGHLAPYVRELADNWRGFEGVKEYASLEGQLELAATHDGVGTVTCRVRLRQPWPPDWSVEAELTFGAGAHLERLADDVAAFVGASA